jgi:DNA-binding transcriptional LysR family regulator
LLDRAETCVRVARGEAGATPVELVLGTRHELGLAWIVPLVEKLEATHPQVTIHLYFGSGPDLENRVRSGEIDCAVTSRPSSDPRLASIRLHREDYVFVGHPTLLRQNRLSRREHAAAHTLVDAHVELPLFRYFKNAREGGDLKFGRVRIMGTIAAIRACVLARRGVAVLPDYLVRGDLAAGRLARVFPRVALASDYFRLIYRADDPKRSVYAELGEEMLRLPLSRGRS